MLFWPVKRATLLIPSGPDHDPDRKHFFILLTDPIAVPDIAAKQVLLVGIATRNPNFQHDPTCILYPGDHPFINRESYVNYRLARIEDADKLAAGVKNGIFVPQGTIDTAIFARVCQGLLNSRHTTPKVLRFYQTSTGR
ncbi:MAG: hypothetical protein AABY73_09150 [Pseudomonadota bacterium]